MTISSIQIGIGVGAMRFLISTLMLVWLVGCTTNSPHRTIAYDAKTPINPEAIKARQSDCLWDGDRDKAENFYLTKASCATNSVEVTNKYTMFFVEFDEQGRLYDDNQYSQLFRYLENRINCGGDLSVVVFVHGWRHNSSTEDTNVRLSRDILSFTYDGENAGAHPNMFREDDEEKGKRNKARCVGEAAKPGAREVVGVYVGWRGKSMDGGSTALLKTWELPSVFDRKNTAENVAIGSARELFSRLRVFQSRQNVNENTCKDGAGAFQCKRVRMLIVGHSFGGLLVYNAVSASIMDSLNQVADLDSQDPANCTDAVNSPDDAPGDRKAINVARGNNRESALVRSFADLIVLVNPAIEGVRFEPLHQSLQRRLADSGFCPNQKPVLIVVTAENDAATHYAFRAVRIFSTLFESTSPKGLIGDDAELRMRVRRQEETEASMNALGHVKRFQTHSLVGSDALIAKPADRLEAAFAPALAGYCARTDGELLDRALRDCRCGAQRWATYIRTKPQNCPTYVEEVNSAQYMLGNGLAGAQTEQSSTLYNSRQWTQGFCGGPLLTHQKDFIASDGNGNPIEKSWAQTVMAPNSPVWIVKSYDTSIIENHSGIESLPFKLFVRQIYHNISVNRFTKDAFRRVESNANESFKRECTAQ